MKAAYHGCRHKYIQHITHLKHWIASPFVAFGRPAPWSLDREVDRKLYHDREEEIKKPGVVVMLDGAIHHGGLTDRIRGILTVYNECRRLNIPFYIYWDNPFNLKDYLIPSTFDWEISKEEISRSRKNSRAVVIDDMTDRESLRRLRYALKNRPAQLHLYTNADSARGNYNQLFNELFRPSPLLENALKKHQESLGPDYISFTSRFLTLLGDFDDWFDVVLSEEERVKLIGKVKGEIRRLISLQPDDSRFFITTDSIRFLSSVKDMDSRIHVVDGEIRHIDLNRDESEDVWLKTFVDQMLLMGSRKLYRMRTDRMYASGFARFAAEVGGCEFIDHVF
ncbi:MAG: hypothetical protein K2N05_12255 [Muribaculaceae bacterium]|nr:hypothetical protein [Muribaculaceae bacterium]